MTWNVKAEFVESCSCNMLCPCWFGVQELMVMDQGWCASAWLIRIDQGNSDGVELGGRTLVIGLDFPGPTLFDGNGTARLYIDDGASAEQRGKLEAIFQGKTGGPMEVIGGLVTKWLPTLATKIEVQKDGDTLTANVGSFGQVISQRLKDEAGQPMTLRNPEFASTLQFDKKTVYLAPSSSKWSDPEMPREFETKSGGVAKISWSGN